MTSGLAGVYFILLLSANAIREQGQKPMARWASRRLLATLLVIVPIMGCGGITEKAQQRQSRLDIVKKRGKLNCGVDGVISGFSFVDERGKYSGLDVDVCKAVAAALFDNPEAVEYRNLDPTERFTAFNGGEVDMLSCTTTWTISRLPSMRSGDDGAQR